MAIKSLTITSEAYEALKTLKHGDESFSDVILRMSKEKIGLSAKYFGSIKMKKYEVDKWKKSILDKRNNLEKEFSFRKKIITGKLN